MHILMVEDDLDLGRALLHALESEELSCKWVRRAADTPQTFFGETVDCVLLDLGLPDESGFELLKQWRRTAGKVPIIIMTARTALEDRLTGLNEGADDFLVKPFAVVELVARIRAVVRRSAQQASETWAFGDLEIEPRRHIARVRGEVTALSPREFALLLELARGAGGVLPKGVLAQKLEPLGDPLDFTALEVHVSNLRRKIGADKIRTVRGVGYMLVV